jgi:hypothetical protein
MPLSNIDGNFFCKTFEIRLSDTDETLYVSGLIEPGMNEHIITLNRPLEAGEYKAALIIKMFTPEEQNFAGETTMDFDLIAEKGEVM